MKNKSSILLGAWIALVLATSAALAKDKDLIERVEDLEASVSQMEGPITVYDQTGREVGTTKDGLTIRARFEGIENTIIEVPRAMLVDPSSQLVQAVFLLPDCDGDVYTPAIPGAANSTLPRLDGTVLVQRLQIDLEGNYFVADEFADPVPPEDLQRASFYANGTCYAGPVVGEIVPIIPVTIDWILPLTTTSPL